MAYARDEHDPEFKKQRPLPLHEFREVGPGDPLPLPELPQNRKCTNVVCLYLLGITLTFWIGFSVYILTSTDIEKVLNGRDFCGNICGMKNFYLPDRTCTPQDFTDYPISLYEIRISRKRIREMVPSQCVKDCDNGSGKKQLIFRRCFPTLNEELPNYDIIYGASRPYRVFEGMFKVAPIFVVMVILACGGSLLMYICFRWNSRRTFWTLVIAGTILLIVKMSVFWYLYSQTKRKDYLTAASLFTGAVVILLLALCSMHDRFKLITDLFEEIIEIIFKVPALLVLPLLTFIFLFAVCGFVMYMTLLTFSDTEFLGYHQLLVRLCYFGLLIFVALWLYSFSNGCQCMIVAGAVASYYFAHFEDKSKLRMPVTRSMMIMLRYHLGTIATGSLLVTILTIVRLIVECLLEESEDENKFQQCLHLCILYTLAFIEEFIEYLTKKTYIMTAIHGRSFLASGKRAARVLWHFLMDTIDVDFFSALTMHAASFIIIVAAMGFGFLIMWRITNEFILIYLLVGSVLAGTATYFYASVMNVAIETLFLCFCEDKLLNDGSHARPYFMSKRLQNIVAAALELAEKEKEERKEKHNQNHNQTKRQSK